ncbi:MAG TPA: hypothetical protein PKK60_01905 [archaeon]|nr:hypothetical protein [archaeon]
MDEKIIGGILSFISSIFFFLTTYFLSATNQTIEIFNTINPIPLTNLIFNENFILFLISASIAFSLLLIISKIYNYHYSSIFCGTSIFLGSIIGLVIFNQMNYLLILIITVIGVIISIKTLNQKEEELKYLKTMRSATNTMGKIILFISIAIFLQLLIINLPKQEEFEKNFVKDIMTTTIGDNNNLNSVKTPMIELAITSQSQTIDLIMNTPPYKKLEDKNDLDIKIFILTMNDLNKKINSKEYKNLYENQLQNNTELPNLTIELMKNSPLIKDFSKLSWIMYAISGLFVSLFIGGIIIKNLSAIIYTIIITIKNKLNEKKLTI